MTGTDRYLWGVKCKRTHSIICAYTSATECFKHTQADKGTYFSPIRYEPFFKGVGDS